MRRLLIVKMSIPPQIDLWTQSNPSQKPSRIWKCKELLNKPETTLKKNNNVKRVTLSDFQAYCKAIIQYHIGSG